MNKKLAVAIAGALLAGTAAADSGRAVFEKTCITCHGKGVLGAPRFGNRQEWAPRIAKGRATLYEHADYGFNSMPAHGGNDDLSDLDVQRAVEYMVDAAGGFPPGESIGVAR